MGSPLCPKYIPGTYMDMDPLGKDPNGESEPYMGKLRTPFGGCLHSKTCKLSNTYWDPKR